MKVEREFRIPYGLAKKLRLGCSDYFYCIDAQLTKYIRTDGPLLNIILVFVYMLLSIMYTPIHTSYEHEDYILARHTRAH
jgi:hypothetical protein